MFFVALFMSLGNLFRSKRYDHDKSVTYITLRGIETDGSNIIEIEDNVIWNFRSKWKRYMN